MPDMNIGNYSERRVDMECRGQVCSGLSFCSLSSEGVEKLVNSSRVVKFRLLQLVVQMTLEGCVPEGSKVQPVRENCEEVDPNAG